MLQLEEEETATAPFIFYTNHVSLVHSSLPEIVKYHPKESGTTKMAGSARIIALGVDMGMGMWAIPNPLEN